MVTSPVVRNGTICILTPAMEENSKAARFCALPVLIVPMLKAAGLALARCNRSDTCFSGLSLPVTMTKSKTLIVATGAKSLFQSNGTDLNSEGEMAFWPLTSSSVWPSASPRATMPAACMPPALGMFSITTGLPSEIAIFCATARAAMSPNPPGPKPTTNLRGRVGKSCAFATPDSKPTTMDADSAMMPLAIFSPSMVSPFPCKLLVIARL